MQMLKVIQMKQFFNNQRCDALYVHVTKSVKISMHRCLMIQTILEDENVTFEIVKNARNLKKAEQMQMLKVIQMKQFDSNSIHDALHM